MVASNETSALVCLEPHSVKSATSHLAGLRNALLAKALRLPFAGRVRLFEIVYEEAWELLAQQFFDVARLTDWSQWQHKFRRRISGEKELNTSIGLMVESLHDPHTRLLDQERARAKRASYPVAVESRVLAADIGYLRLRHFQASRLADLVAQDLALLANSRGLIIDLRQNLGGSVIEALEVASLFLKAGKIISIKERKGGTPASPHYVNRTYSVSSARLQTEITCSCNAAPIVFAETRKPYLGGDRPVVLLSDNDTASAAEMVIGALKDNDAATIIGSRSYGKGTGQLVQPLANGAELHLTTLEFRTPGGFWPGDGSGAATQGIKPDITVDYSPAFEFGGGNDKQLQTAIAWLSKRGSDRYIDRAIGLLGRALAFK